MSIELKVKKYKDILDILPTPQEKYQYLIEQARSSNEFPEELRQDTFKVPGCASQVWLVPVEKDGYLNFICDSDALIAKGMVNMITDIYSGETPESISSSKIDLMEEFDLGVILSPARRNGAFNMLKKIKYYAEGLL
jgi:cysteine desulfuration protein SufE